MESFEKWWQGIKMNPVLPSEQEYARAAWNAATRQEREACAKIADNLAEDWKIAGSAQSEGCRAVAAAIRARKDVP